MLTTILLLAGLSAFVTLVVMTWFKRSERGVEAFLVANRSVWSLVVGGWMALAFVWGTTFFYLGQLAYTDGIVGVAIFAFGNTGGLALNMFLSWRIKRAKERFTYAEVVEEQYDAKTGTLTAIVTTGVQALYALTFQFIVVAALIQLAWHVDPHVTIFWAALAMVVPTLVGGLLSSEVEDTLKFVMIASLLVMIPFAVINAGGISAVAGGLGGHDAAPIIGAAALTFFLVKGLGVIVSLVSAGAIDQALYQRFFAISYEQRRGFLGRFMAGRPGTRTQLLWALVLGIVLFVIIHVAVALLGFLAANPGLGVHVGTPRVAAFAALGQFLPIGATLFVVTVLVATAASGDTALNAASSVFLVDIYKKRLRPLIASVGSVASTTELKLVQRCTMLACIAGAASLAWWGLDILTLTIGVAIFRSPLTVPIVLGSIRGKGLPGMFWAIIAAVVACALLVIPGQICTSSGLTPYWSHACSRLPIAGAQWYAAAGALAGWVITGVWAFIVLKLRRPSAVAMLDRTA